MATNSQQVRVSRTCPRCFGRVEVTATEHYCNECGLVVEDRPIDRGPDWRNLDEGDDKSHASPAGRDHRNQYTHGMGSDIGRDGNFNARQRTINTRVKRGKKKDRNRGYATGEIHRIASTLDIPEHVRERAKRIFTDLHQDHLEGQNLDELAPACLYAACREYETGRVPSEIAEGARCDERPIRRRVWWVANELGLELPPPNVHNRIRVVADKLRRDRKAVQRAIERLAELDGCAVSRGSPSTLAAALLYQAGEWRQADVADAAGVSCPGLRARRDELDG